MQAIRTLIADGHPIFLKGLEIVLQQIDAPNIDIIDKAQDGAQALEILQKGQTDFLIFDLNLPEIDGIELLKQIKRYKIPVHTLLLTMYDNPKFIRAAFKQGVDGYMLKNREASELKEAVSEINLLGRTYMGAGVHLNRRTVFKSTSMTHPKYRSADGFIKRHSLTKRELEILHLITQALSNKEIGKTLFISDQTVSVHRKNIMRKLGVSNTAGLIKAAYDHSLV